MLKNTAVCSWSLLPKDPCDLAASTVTCGLKHIQLALDPLTTGAWTPESLTQALTDSNLSICSAMMTTIGEDYTSLESIKHTGGLRPDQHWETNQQRACDAAKIANQLGTKLVTLHAGFIPEHNTREYTTITDRIKSIAEIFADYNIILALETGQERAESLLEMLASPSMSTIGINFDPANMILYNMGNPADALELLSDRIVQVHMKDATPTQTPNTWGSEVPAGTGSVNWDHFFQTLSALPQHINVVIEREAGDDRINDIIQARTIATQHGCPNE